MLCWQRKCRTSSSNFHLISLSLDHLPKNVGGKEEEDSNSKQQAKNENRNIATPNVVEVSFHRNAHYRNINDGLDSSPEAGTPMSVDTVNEDEDADAAGNDQGGGVLSPSIIQSFGKLSLVSPPSDTNK